MRAVLGVSVMEHMPCSELLKKTKQKSMFEISLKAVVNEAWKSFAKNDAPNRQHIEERLEKRNPRYPTRATTKGNIMVQSNATPLNNMIKLWNILPQTLKNEKCCRIAKVKIDKFAEEKAQEAL